MQPTTEEEQSDHARAPIEPYAPISSAREENSTSTKQSPGRTQAPLDEQEAAGAAWQGASSASAMLAAVVRMSSGWVSQHFGTETLPPREIIRAGDPRLRLYDPKDVDALNAFTSMKATMHEMGYDSDDMEEGDEDDGDGDGEEEATPPRPRLAPGDDEGAIETGSAPPRPRLAPGDEEEGAVATGGAPPRLKPRLRLAPGDEEEGAIATGGADSSIGNDSKYDEPARSSTPSTTFVIYGLILIVIVGCIVGVSVAMAGGESSET